MSVVSRRTFTASTGPISRTGRCDRRSSVPRFSSTPPFSSKKACDGRKFSVILVYSGLSVFCVVDEIQKSEDRARVSPQTRLNGIIREQPSETYKAETKKSPHNFCNNCTFSSKKSGTPSSTSCVSAVTSLVHSKHLTW